MPRYHLTRAPEGVTKTPEGVTGKELSGWINLSEGHISRLKTDGVLPKQRNKRYPLRESVRAYVCYMQALVKRSGNGAHQGESTNDDDPDDMAIEDRLKYWQAVRHQQHAEEHLQEIVAAMAKEYQAQLAKALAKLSQALSDADLPPATLRKLHAAFPRSTGTE